MIRVVMKTKGSEVFRKAGLGEAKDGVDIGECGEPRIPRGRKNFAEIELNQEHHLDYRNSIDHVLGLNYSNGLLYWNHDQNVHLHEKQRVVVEWMYEMTENFL
ncbi:hypothetical protein Salat_1642900 [Sesamum alatum]|uniref:Uncharacterized protein n=1 Tax=Sesamum alatum TaxID=300844 RepID=A0AAE1Y6A2_9LAMI|nr:hypothetical protein Salat_1642900 [Sesamum alatum]